MSDKPVPWPQKYDKFYRQVQAARGLILEGSMLAIDPSSRTMGYAFYDSAVLVTSGTLSAPAKMATNDRLIMLHDRIQELVPSPPDVMAIEEIRGKMAPYQLHWSVGGTITAVRPPVLIEVPINVWKPVSRLTDWYFKDDEIDARMIGHSLIRLVKEHPRCQS